MAGVSIRMKETTKRILKEKFLLETRYERERRSRCVTWLPLWSAARSACVHFLKRWTFSPNFRKKIGRSSTQVSTWGWSCCNKTRESSTFWLRCCTTRCQILEMIFSSQLINGSFSDKYFSSLKKRTESNRRNEVVSETATDCWRPVKRD